MEEEWRDIPGFEGIYQVSSFGRVKSLERYITGEGRGFPRTQKEKIMRPIILGNGYFGVHFCLNGAVVKKSYIHRLVASVFIPNPENKSDVNHIDGDKENNNIQNLEWCTRDENNKHAWRTGLSKPHHNQVNKKPVKVISKSGDEEIFDSIEEAAKALSVCASGVSRAAAGIKTSVRGFKCVYI